jgi:hypothetical protein
LPPVVGEFQSDLVAGGEVLGKSFLRLAFPFGLEEATRPLAELAGVDVDVVQLTDRP